jgi:hypothetical protein
MGKLFNPYWDSRPPECCYCPPIAPAPMPPGVTVTTTLSLEGGLGSLAFMTRSEDAFRVLEEQRQLKKAGKVPQLWIEVGHGPWAAPWQNG